MTRSLTNRRTAGIVAAALAMGIAAPAAGARPIDVGPSYSFTADGPPVTPVTTVHSATSHSGGGVSDLGYVAIGSGVAGLALIGLGGTQASRRRRQRVAAQPRIAA